MQALLKFKPYTAECSSQNPTSRHYMANDDSEVPTFGYLIVILQLIYALLHMVDNS